MFGFITKLLKNKNSKHSVSTLVTLKQVEVLPQQVVSVMIRQKFRRNQFTAVKSLNFMKSSFSGGKTVPLEKLLQVSVKKSLDNYAVQ